MRDHSEHEPTSPQGIKSIEVGLPVLLALAGHNGSMALKDLAQVTGLATPKVHRYLVSFIRAGFVIQAASSGHYDLGPSSVTLGLSALGRLDHEGIARRSMSALSKSVGETCCLAVWTNNGVTIIAVEAAVRSVFMGIRIGSKLSLTRSASGQIFLAHLSQDITRAELQGERANELVLTEDLSTLVHSVRDAGISTVRDTMLTGISALSAPVYDHNGTILFALTVLGSTPGFDTSVDGTLANKLRDEACSLSSHFGYDKIAK